MRNNALKEDILAVMRINDEECKQRDSHQMRDWCLDFNQILRRVKELRVIRVLEELEAEGRIYRDGSKGWRLKK